MRGLFFFATNPTGMSRTATSTGYFYPDCPGCGREVMWPVSKKADVVAFQHGRSDCNARLIVRPDPTPTQQHCVDRLPRNVSMEEVMEAYQEHDGPPWRWSVVDARAS